MGLTITDLTKRYGRTTALDHMGLELRSGTIYGLFGRNGAGKSTLLGCLGNRLIPTAGHIELDGDPLPENESAMARTYLADDRWPWHQGVALTKVFDDCERMYGGFDRELADAMCERLDLAVEGRHYGGLSLGQRTMSRVMLGLCLPVDYLFLDEPTTGLDPVSRRMLIGFIMEAYTRRRRTIVISTHEIGEFAGVVERAVIVDRGRVLDAFAVQDLYRRAVLLGGPYDAIEAFASAHGARVADVEDLGGAVSALVVPGAGVADADLSAVVADGLPSGVHARTPDIQTYFIRLVQGRR